MLANKYKNQFIEGWYCSEKLDGIRCYWDGGLSRGKLCSEVTYANTEKDARLVTPPVATGLWSRYWKPIHAPGWWLDELPRGMCLDGELWMGRQSFQGLMSAKKLVPVDNDWQKIKYMVFDSPSQIALLKVPGGPSRSSFRHVYNTILLPLTENRVVQIVKQTRITGDDLQTQLDEVLEQRGEGLMLRNPDSFWLPKRSSDLLKVKPYTDDEGIVTGWEPGVGKFEGMMGSLRVLWGQKTFNLSGFTDEERRLGELPTGVTWPLTFLPGSIVTFKYRELSQDGIPREARFMRKASCLLPNRLRRSSTLCGG